MVYELKIFVIFTLFSLAAYVAMRLSFGVGKYTVPQLVAYVGLFSVAIFTHNTYLVFLFVFLLKFLYLKNDIEKNILFFIFLYPLIPISTVVPFLNPGGAYFVDLNFQRVLALVLLLPLFLPIRRLAADKPDLYKWDLVFLFLGMIFLVGEFRERSEFEVTLFSSIRDATGFVLDVVIPYLVISRGLQTFKQMGFLAQSIVFSGLIVAFAGVAEAGFSWKVYYEVGAALSDYRIADYEAMYEFRQGILRVSSSLTHPITLGFYMTFVIGFVLFLFVKYRVNIIRRVVVLAPILFVVYATGSRGAMVGAALLIITYVYYSFNRAFRKLLFVQAVVIGGAAVFFYLNPAVFSNDTQLDQLDSHGTFEYRARLAEVALEVIPENLYWGTRTYRDNPKMQELVQGQGIIDMVNGYINITIEYGLVAMILFILLMLRALVVGGRWVSLGDEFESPQHKFLGVAVITILLSMALQFAFTSFVGFVFVYLWLVFALARNFRYVLENTYDEIDANNGELPELDESSVIADSR